MNLPLKVELLSLMVNLLTAHEGPIGLLRSRLLVFGGQHQVVHSGQTDHLIEVLLSQLALHRSTGLLFDLLTIRYGAESRWFEVCYGDVCT